MKVNHLMTNFYFNTSNLNKTTFIYLFIVCMLLLLGYIASWRSKGQVSGLVLSSIFFEVGSLISVVALYAESHLGPQASGDSSVSDVGYHIQLFCVGFRNVIQVVRLGSKYLHPWSRLATPLPRSNTLNTRSVTVFSI